MIVQLHKALAAVSAVALLASGPAIAAEHAKPQAKTEMQKKDMGMDKAVTDPNNFQTQRRTSLEESECLAELRELDRNYASYPSYTRNDFRVLEQAAQVFAINGNEEACNDVVEGIGELNEKESELMAKARKADVAPERVRDIEAAVPTSELERNVRASDVIGLSIRNMQDESLGNVEDVILDAKTGNIRYLLVGEGGFLGIGEDWVAIPWKKLKVGPDFDSAYLNMSQEAFKKAPKVTDRDLREGDPARWMQSNDAYYESSKDK